MKTVSVATAFLLVICLAVGLAACGGGGPAAGKIAFACPSDVHEYGLRGFDICVMNADGSDQVNLTRESASGHSPAWSPDGTRIAFASNRDGNGEIYVMNADGSGQTRLTDNPAAEAFPAWSPDGSRIAFVSGRDGNLEVYVMNADGSGQTNLTDNPATDGSAAWSP